MGGFIGQLGLQTPLVNTIINNIPIIKSLIPPTSTVELYFDSDITDISNKGKDVKIRDFFRDFGITYTSFRGSNRGLYTGLAWEEYLQRKITLQ